MIGQVIYGTKNVFLVLGEDGRERECRLKGKVLKAGEGFYNPLAPGDRVFLEPESDFPDKALIVDLQKRENAFTRFNQKGQAPQLLAANLDQVLCVVCPDSPPFRPRFLDRVLVQADINGIEPLIVVNKWDLNVDDPDIDERLEDFERIGFKVLRVSALSGEGLEELRDVIANRFSALVGQSGVGKTSLLNALAPGLDLRVGDLCEKYDRGSHTTTMARVVTVPTLSGTARIVDTPGVRRLLPAGATPATLALHFREIAPLVGRCTYGLSCAHETDPGCKIMEAVAAGVIHEDRYESYLRLRDELADLYS